jgi:hypothetical protein
VACLCTACRRTPETGPHEASREPTVVGYFSIAPGSEFAAVSGARFGGLSGAVFDRASGELLALSDDRMEPRVFRLRVHQDPLTVEPAGIIALQGTPVAIDPEGLTILPDGHLLVSSEGVQNREPRSPPGLFEYTSDGAFVRALQVRARFIPPENGPIGRGVRENASFESLTLSADGSQVFTATETALAQDGEPANFDRGTRVRLLEYVKKGDAFVPNREWVYDVDATSRPSFNVGFTTNGVVELATDGATLLALERSYVENKDDPAQSVNRIRLYRVAFDGASDVSSLETISGRTDLRSVRKGLVLDLDRTTGLPAGFAALDNFEALALDRPGPDGRRPLYIISDDNFSKTQRSWFLRVRF